VACLLLAEGYKVLGTSRDAQTGGFADLVWLGVRDRVRLMPWRPVIFAAC
jgi:GDPmannose 4,6-dehydratase